MTQKIRQPICQQKPQGDKFRTYLELDSRDKAAEFNRAYPLLNEVASEVGAKGALRLTFHLTEEQIKALKSDGYVPEVTDNISAIGRERQKEVGTGDRFEGGRIPPKPRGLPRHGGR